MSDAETSAVYAQEIMRLKKEIAALRQDASSKWAFLEWRDRAEKAEAENAALRDWGEPVAWCWMDEEIGFGFPPDAVSQEATLLYAKKEEGK
jgi:hypothetical protein